MTDKGVRHEDGDSVTNDPALRDKQELNLGFGRATNVAFELAATPAVFAGFGWLIDRWVGTHLVFMLSFLVFAVVGTFVKVWLRYDEEMRQIEAATPWGRAKARRERHA